MAMFTVMYIYDSIKQNYLYWGEYLVKNDIAGLLLIIIKDNMQNAIN